MQPTFHVGDIVRINPHGRYADRGGGGTGRITEIDRGRDHPIHVIWDNDSGNVYGRGDLLLATTPQVGDRVQFLIGHPYAGIGRTGVVIPALADATGRFRVRPDNSMNPYGLNFLPQWLRVIQHPARPEKKATKKESKKATMTKSVLESLPKAAEKELEAALKFIQECPYKGTAIKVELEAQLNRGAGDDEYCDECGGDGEIYDSDRDTYETCEECGGSGHYESGGFGSDRTCQEFILNYVPKAVAKRVIFSRFYYDGSVDSEFTFTYPIAHAKEVVYFVEAFNALAKEIGHSLETSGAGMHMAILNDPKGRYCTSDSRNSINATCRDNFTQAMYPLLPALFFLASPDNKSRGLGYRAPHGLCQGGKSHAIAQNNGVFEYRVFETCYQRPLAIIDNIIVIAKTLQFYKPEPTDTKLGIGQLGFKDGRGLDRFYFSTKHVEALKHGLRYLKPDYLTIEQLEAQRGVKISETAITEREAKMKAEWLEEYKSVKERRKFERMRLYHSYLSSAYSNRLSGKDAIEYAKKRLAEHTTLKGSGKKYVDEKLKAYQSQPCEYNVNI